MRSINSRFTYLLARTSRDRELGSRPTSNSNGGENTDTDADTELKYRHRLSSNRNTSRLIVTNRELIEPKISIQNVGCAADNFAIITP